LLTAYPSRGINDILSTFTAIRLLALIDVMSDLLLDIEDVLIQGLHTTL
jgi:hypothetical protein